MDSKTVVNLKINNKFSKSNNDLAEIYTLVKWGDGKYANFKTVNGVNEYSIRDNDIDKVTVQSIPTLSKDNKIIFLDQLKQDDIINLDDNDVSDNEILKFKYYTDTKNKKVVIYLETLNAIDWSSEVQNMYLYRLVNGSISTAYDLVEVKDAYGGEISEMSDSATIHFSYDDLETFYLFEFKDRFKAMVVTDVIKDGDKYYLKNGDEKKEIDADDFSKTSEIKFSLSESVTYDANIIVENSIQHYIYCPCKKDGDPD